jgi:hypothetical protein
VLGHLKAEDFVNLMEGAELSLKQRKHIGECSRCHATWEYMRSAHSEMSSLETDIPEPDWSSFRSSVRDELLSRSIQRQSTVRRWTGWAIRPATAWALSLLLAIGVTTVTVLWKSNTHVTVNGPNVSGIPPVEPAAEVIEAGPEKALFEDVMSLGEEQQEQLRQMLESAPSVAYKR